MAQQTAVEFIIQEFLNKKFRTLEGRKETFEQAKAMEKEQIVNAFENGIVAYDNPDRMNDDINFDAENYYNEIYNK